LEREENTLSNQISVFIFEVDVVAPSELYGEREG
jgi:hypothetical protein